jgi:hypothetical protein
VRRLKFILGELEIAGGEIQVAAQLDLVHFLLLRLRDVPPIDKSDYRTKKKRKKKRLGLTHI